MDIKKEVRKKSYYNREDKIRFLLDLDDTEFTIDKKAYSLQKVRLIEEELKKELIYFNCDEIEYTMENLEYRHIMNLNLALETFMEYTSFKTGIENNLYRGYKRAHGKELSKYIVDLKLEKYFSRARLECLLDEIETNREKGLILCLYEGIRGKHLYEIRTLKMENIDEINNRVRVMDYDGSYRYVEISEQLKNILFEISNEKSIVLNDDKRYRQRYFENTPYIFRSAEYSSLVRNIDLEERIISNHTINSIFKSIQKSCEQCQYLTPVSLVNSGIYNRLIKAHRDGIVMNYENVKELLKEYHFSKSGIYGWIRKFKDLKERLMEMEEMEAMSLEELLN